MFFFWSELTLVGLGSDSHSLGLEINRIPNHWLLACGLLIKNNVIESMSWWHDLILSFITCLLKPGFVAVLLQDQRQLGRFVAHQRSKEGRTSAHPCSHRRCRFGRSTVRPTGGCHHLRDSWKPGKSAALAWHGGEVHHQQSWCKSHLVAKLGAGRDLLNAIEKDLATKTKVYSQKDLACEFITFFGGFLCLGFFRISSRHPRRRRTFWDTKYKHHTGPQLGLHCLQS